MCNLTNPITVVKTRLPEMFVTLLIQSLWLKLGNQKCVSPYLGRAEVYFCLPSVNNRDWIHKVTNTSDYLVVIKVIG